MKAFCTGMRGQRRVLEAQALTKITWLLMSQSIQWKSDFQFRRVFHFKHKCLCFWGTYGMKTTSNEKFKEIVRNLSHQSIGHLSQSTAPNTYGYLSHSFDIPEP